jgi:hypothetical protein
MCMFNMILGMVKVAVLAHGASVMTVDRVEADYSPVAVVCTAVACVDVATVEGNGGLYEGQSIGRATVARK